MRARRQSDSILPERPKGVHEYRAALLSVFLHTHSRGDLSETLEPEKRPLPLSDAIKLLEELPAEQADPAREIAGCQLANAVIVEHKEQFEPQFREVMGVDSQEFKKRLQAALPTPPPDIGGPWVNYDLLRQVFYGGLAGELVPGMEAQEASRPRAVSAPAPSLRITPSATLTNLDECFKHAGESLMGSGPESTLDLTSLVTTVDIPSTSNCDFATLARILDPRSWSLSPFWPESYEVQLSKDGEGFTQPGATNSSGESWSGYLFEHVEWNWNISTVASFRNYLNIKYEVDTANQRLRLDFALFSCEGSQLYLLEQRQRGIDVDSGFQCVAPVPGANPPGGQFRLRTVKNIRYTDLLDRQTPGQGPAGAGQFLSYLAPAVVGLWMNDLLRQLYCPSQP